VLGVIVADNKFTRLPIDIEDVSLLHTFANTAAVAIDNIGLLQETQAGREKLRSLFRASNALVSSQEPRHVLRQVVEQPPVMAEAAWVQIILIDEMGYAREQIVGGGANIPLDQAIRSDGISMTVMRSGTAVVIEDVSRQRERVNPFMLDRGIGAALCFPFSLHGRPIGVMWINYAEPRTFLEFEIEALQLYVNHAAIAYESARRLDELGRLHYAAATIAGAFGQTEEERTAEHRTSAESVLRAVVERAGEFFQADSSVIWAYDQAREKFLPEESFAIGHPDEGQSLYGELEPTPAGTTYEVLRRGWVGVPDIERDAHPFLSAATLENLRRIGVRSFQGIALMVGHEPVGVLYVGYRKPRPFGEEDQRALESFAAYAALSIKNARLLDQIKRAKTAAEVVAKVSVLGDLRETLSSVARGTMTATGGDVVVLYAHDQNKNRWLWPPTSVGVRYPQRAWPEAAGQSAPAIDSDSIINKVFQSHTPLIIERIGRSDLLGTSRFAREEGIKSCVAIPLAASGQKVGLMFVNYREPHRFTRDELSSIQLFANQAAVAIRNAQLFDNREQQLQEQRALVSLSKGLLGTVRLQETMDYAVTFAARILNADFCTIVLPDETGKLTMAAVHGWEPGMAGAYEFEGGRLSQTGHTIETRAPVVVDDYAQVESFIGPPIVYEYGISSGVSVPMFSGEKVVGAMLVHTRARRRFSDNDVNLLSLVANQTAIAVENAKRYEAIERKGVQLRALYEATKRITAPTLDLGVKGVLSHIVQQAVECLGSGRSTKGTFGMIYLYDEAKDEMFLGSVFPPEEYPTLVSRIGERWSLNRSVSGSAPIGLEGRTVVTMRPQRVTNVAEDPDYIMFAPETMSGITMPLINQGKVLGVLKVESDRVAAFDDDDLTTLQALSELAVIVIRNAGQHDELRRTKGLVGGRTVLAWLGMTSSVWRHAIENHAITIARTMDVIAEDLPPNVLTGPMLKRIERIRRLTEEILKKPITPPLSSEEGAEFVDISALTRERVTQLRGNQGYEAVDLAVGVETEKQLIVRGSPGWFRQILDLLLENAVKATAKPESDVRWIRVKVNGEGDWAKIAISDSGVGIPPGIKDVIFSGPVRNTGEAGLGMGLLMAQTIAEAYGGRIEVGATGPDGTTMLIYLPLAA
jgi:GAF domain-containing protein